MTEVANQRRNASWKRVVRLAAQGLAERAPRVREMAVLPVDARDKPGDKPDHEGEGRGFHPPRLIHRGNASGLSHMSKEIIPEFFVPRR